MIKNYLKIAWRNVMKNRLLSVINLGGLSVGITAVLLIGLFLYSERNYDNFQQNKSSIYRVGFHFWQNGKPLGEGAEFTPPFGTDAQNEFPQIKSYTRISSSRVAYITHNDKTLRVDNIHHADSNFFRFFSYKLILGNPSAVLKEPYSIVLTTATAKKLFGDEEKALGKLVRLNNQTDYMVSGIAMAPPSNSHLSYNALISFATLYKDPDNFMDWNGGEQYITYLQLFNKTNRVSLEKMLPAFMWKHINSKYSKLGFKVDASLQPIQDIHLYYSDNSGTLRTNIYVFSIVALLVLIISCVNYVNLTIAQAITRFKEVGVRKVLGAVRIQLIIQFLIETILATIIAFVIAITLGMLLMPVYQPILGKYFSPVSMDTLPVLLLLLGVIMFLGVITGIYIAFYLSSFSVTKIFRALLPRSTQSFFRKGLIVTQFAISIGLTACTLLIALQLKYTKTINLGYDRDHILVLPLIGNKTRETYPLLQQKLAQLPGVKETSALSEIPYDDIANNGFVPEGDTKGMIIHQLDADENFLKTFNTSLVAGNYFSKDRPMLNEGYIINETLAKTLGWKDPLGKTISRNGEHKVVGVIKDFHFASLHNKIEPLIITNSPWGNHYSYLAVKYQTVNTTTFLDNIKKTWKNILPDAAFDYWFLDDAFNNIYKSEEHFQQLFLYFSALSILLSLAGVFGLVTLGLKQRTKEFGIRKVLGAGITDIINLTVKDFIWLIVTAGLIAIPLSWYYMNAWLQNFAYRISINGWAFGISGFVILLITVSVISFQAIKAASANPVKSLRME